MAELHWQAAVDTVLYGLAFTPALDDEAVDTTARQLIARRRFRRPTEEYYDKVKYALTQNVPLNSSGLTNHDEVELRRFFQRLLARLDELRPWPEPPFLKQDIALWNTFATARPIATINATKLDVRDWLVELFDRLPDGDEERYGLILRLRSGRVVALLAPPNRTTKGVTILQQEPDDPAAAIADFCEATGYSRDQITIIPAKYGSL
jgi:hypothetical protein